MSWDQEAPRAIEEAIYADAEGVDSIEREAIVADVMERLAPVVAREVARAELRGALSAPEVVAAVEVLALTTSHTAQSITDAAQTVAKAMRATEAAGS